ncbi:hypothetical protein Ddc_09243 [Ditylenchus destructor]|nr:hypothetical protein Ddc_09243 [Ditylenchus destructor]
MDTAKYLTGGQASSEPIQKTLQDDSLEQTHVFSGLPDSVSELLVENRRSFVAQKPNAGGTGPLTVLRKPTTSGHSCYRTRTRIQSSFLKTPGSIQAREQHPSRRDSHIAVLENRHFFFGLSPSRQFVSRIFIVSTARELPRIGFIVNIQRLRNGFIWDAGSPKWRENAWKDTDANLEGKCGIN